MTTMKLSRTMLYCACLSLTALAADSYSTLMDQAAIAAKARNTAGAEALYREAAAAARHSDEAASAWYRLGMLQRDLKDYNRAMAAFEAMAAVNGITRHNANVAWRAMAQTRMAMGKTRDAIRLYRLASQVPAGTWVDAVSFRELAEIYEKLGFYPELLETLQAWLKTPKLSTEDRIYASAGIVQARAKLGEFAKADEAMTALQELLKTTDNPLCALQAGFAAAALADARGDYAGAVSEYRRLTALPGVDYAKHYARRRKAANSAALIALRNMNNLALAKEILDELMSTDKYGADEALSIEIKQGLKK